MLHNKSNRRATTMATRRFYNAQIRQLHKELPRWSTQNYCAIRKYYESKLRSLGPSPEA